mgnify:CR=1 FL=1
MRSPLAASTFSGVHCIFGLPTWRTRSSCASITAAIPVRASSSASSRRSSLTSFAPASIIITASRVPATTRSSSLFVICVIVGFRVRVPSTVPTRTQPIGPPNGAGEIASAADAAFTARTSGSCSWSAESA